MSLPIAAAEADTDRDGIPDVADSEELEDVEIVPEGFPQLFVGTATGTLEGPQGALAGFRVNPEGTLSVVPRSPFGESARAQGVARLLSGLITAGPLNRTVQVDAWLTPGDQAIRASSLFFDIDPGTPTPLIFFNRNVAMLGITKDGQGQLIFLEMAADGQMREPIGRMTFPGTITGVDVASGTFVLASHGTGFTVGRFDQAGRAYRPISGSPFPNGTGANSASLHCVDDRIYITATNGQLASQLTTGNGAPVLREVIDVGQSRPTRMADTDDTLYVVNEGSDTVSAYQIRNTGGLAPVPGSPFPTGKRPAYLAPVRLRRDAGTFLYVSNFDSNSVSGYKVTAPSQFLPESGRLTPVPGESFGGVTRPSALSQ